MKNPISQLMAAVERRRAAKAKAARTAAALIQLMVLDAEFRGCPPFVDRTGRDVFGVVHAERVTR